MNQTETEEGMGNSMEVTGEQTSQGGAGTQSASTGAGQGINDSTRSQEGSLIDKAKSTAQDRVRSAAMSGKTQAVEVVGGLAQSLLLAGQQLQDQQSPAARLVEQAADRLDRVTRYIENTEPEQLIQRTENWARQNPALFIGAAFIVGALGARFLKSSPPPSANYSGDGSPGRFSDREISRAPAVEEL
jgi:ElaB/YqjD/DUF883 family membrane-anchored ribosome-binding protein